MSLVKRLAVPAVAVAFLASLLWYLMPLLSDLPTVVMPEPQVEQPSAGSESDIVTVLPASLPVMDPADEQIIQPIPTVAVEPDVPLDPSELSRGSIEGDMVIFTFDGGSGSQSSQQILDVLALHHLKATFFLTGSWVEHYPELTLAIVQAGHEIGNHTYTHPYLTRISDAAIREELSRTDDLVFSTTGQSTKPYFRPPYGDRNTHVLEVAYEAGYRGVYWTIDALDWKESEGMTTDEVKDRIYARVGPGAIILMHMGDTLTGQVLDEVITVLEDRGYSLVPLSAGI